MSSQSSGMPMGVTITSPFVVAADGFGGLQPEKQHLAVRIGRRLAISVEIGFSLVT